MQTENDKNNVVSIFAARQKSEATKKDNQEEKDGSLEDLFEDIIRRNLQNSDRQKKDRNKANKSVLRSYRIKN